MLLAEQNTKPIQMNRKTGAMVSSSHSYHPVPLPAHHRLPPEKALAEAKNFLEKMSKRHSIRDFSDVDIDEIIIKTAIRTAARAPSGANQQPWHFVAIKNAEIKRKIRDAAEAEELAFYNGGGGDEWLKALEPIGTDADKPHITTAPWLIIVFAQRYGLNDDGTRYKHFYVPESVGIASGILITALHNCGLSTLVHTPNPMSFLNKLCKRPKNEKPMMILAIGYPTPQATVPKASLIKKAEEDILSVF